MSEPVMAPKNFIIVTTASFSDPWDILTWFYRRFQEHE